MDDKKYAELRECLSIDRNALDDALIRQPQIYQEISEELTLAVSRKDQAAEGIKLAEAQADNAIRNDLMASGGKATEAAISSMVKLSDERQEAVNDHLLAKYEAERLSALKDSFHQRSYMLKELTGLYISGYFSMDAVSTKKTGVGTTARDARVHRLKKENL
jgi:hypothetical protein